MSDTSDVVRVVVKPRRARPFFGRHPWVFESAIDGVESQTGKEPEAGTAVQLWSTEGRFIAHGLWNPNSTIRVRLYSWQQSDIINEDFLTARVQEAVQLRRSLFNLNDERTGCRLIFSEADNLSGLTVDFYGRFLLVQFTSLALYLQHELIVGILARELAPKGIWLRTEKGMREAEGLQAVDGLIVGKEPPRPLFIDAHGVQFGIDVVQGQKTGFYLDQRDNRLAASRYMSGRRILDGFCFSGGFGITALCQGGATAVVGIDSSESALKLASANAELNNVAEHCKFRRGDVRAELETLKGQDATFDAVILDPPRMARSRGGIGRAVKGYSRLNLAGLELLRPGGILVTCSCSGLVSSEEFREMISDVARTSERTIQILEQHSQPCDHPVSATCAETEYLKMLICRVL
ncbi:MAG: class I SAM-dependent rRNA methyltransferase [Fuerstiella sp.]|nr:class I SAM-dependent rRNA methyltransferase [Fuerstiella sp.]MCP4508843.1 class I SAM-dependent rRNA methyltransferase [Fuerstiella sp.]